MRIQIRPRVKTIAPDRYKAAFMTGLSRVCVDCSRRSGTRAMGAVTLLLSADIARAGFQFPMSGFRDISLGESVLSDTRRSQKRNNYSHSIVAGGLPEMSYTTREMPETSFTMRRDTCSRNS